MHGSHLKLFSDLLLDTKAIMSNVLNSGTGFPGALLRRCIETDEGLKVLVRWKELCPTEYNLDPIAQIHEDVCEMF